jgi:hypothetical protein
MLSAAAPPELPHRRAPSRVLVSFTLYCFSTSGSTSVSTNSAYARHRVVFQPALAALRVAAAVADGDRDHRPARAFCAIRVVERVNSI